MTSALWSLIAGLRDKDIRQFCHIQLKRWTSSYTKDIPTLWEEPNFETWQRWYHIQGRFIIGKTK